MLEKNLKFIDYLNNEEVILDVFMYKITITLSATFYENSAYYITNIRTVYVDNYGKKIYSSGHIDVDRAIREFKYKNVTRLMLKVEKAFIFNKKDCFIFEIKPYLENSLYNPEYDVRLKYFSTQINNEYITGYITTRSDKVTKVLEFKKYDIW